MASMFGGVADTLNDNPHDFQSLARDHATPGGTNEQFASALQDAGVCDAVRRSLGAVLRRLQAAPS